MTRYPGRTMGIGERPPLPNVLPLPVTLGTPITESTAIALRQIVFGQCPSMVRSEFFSRGPAMVFREAEQQLGYGLAFSGGEMTPMARSVLMIVQAQILRSLLFETDPARVLKSRHVTEKNARSSGQSIDVGWTSSVTVKSKQRPSSTDQMAVGIRRDPLEPTRTIQREALVAALTDILWRAGNGQSTVLCLPNKNITYLSESPEFNQDGVTEKLQLITFTKMEELQSTLRRYIHIFQEEPGPAILLLLYSAVLSRGIDRVNEDLCGRAVNYSGFVARSHLLSYKGNVSNSVMCLLMTGRATPFLHNGVQYRGDEDNAAVAETGVLIRSPLGLLVWMGNEEKTAAANLGSRLKTPIYPIWLVICCDHAGLLFCLDRALMRDYRNEYNFQLHYFTSSHFQSSNTILNISTRGFDDSDQSDSPQSSTLDKIIRTKWSGARVNWNGVTPFL